MRIPQKVLLATDGSEDAALAAGVSAWLSGEFGSELHVVHAWHYPPPSFAYLGVETKDYGSISEQWAGEVLADQAKYVERLGAAVTGTHLRQGPSVDAILDLCEELAPVLLVVGSRGLGPVRRVLLGSVSEGLVHHARCPVLVVRGEEDAWPPKRVVVGDDFSEDSKAAAELALGIGESSGAPALLVHAHPEMPQAPEMPPHVPDYGRDFYGRMVEDLIYRERQALEDRARELERSVGRHPDMDVRLEDASAAILAAAGDDPSTLIAVGSRGLGAINRLRLGSVSTKVLRAAEGPVLVYPHHRS